MFACSRWALCFPAFWQCCNLFSTLNFFLQSYKGRATEQSLGLDGFRDTPATATWRVRKVKHHAPNFIRPRQLGSKILSKPSNQSNYPKYSTLIPIGRGQMCNPSSGKPANQRSCYLLHYKTWWLMVAVLGLSGAHLLFGHVLYDIHFFWYTALSWKTLSPNTSTPAGWPQSKQ